MRDAAFMIALTCLAPYMMLGAFLGWLGCGWYSLIPIGLSFVLAYYSLVRVKEGGG